MSIKDILIEKLRDKRAVLGVVGLGYVGLPLAVEKAAAGYRVIGFDIQRERVDMVNMGLSYIDDVADEDISELVGEGRLSATADYSRISEVDVVAVAVPTPLDGHRQPDLSYIINSASSISNYLHRGMLVVLESTTYPGTTEEVVKPILERSGLICGRDFFLAYSPERVDPGNKQFKTKNTPKVVGGVTRDCTEVAAELYRNVLEGEVFTVSNTRVAEMEKILENTFRNINVAFINEMSILCFKMGIDLWEVIEAAKTKPYGFMAFYPGPGVGGHCIPIDPLYLTWKAREYDFRPRLIDDAGEINDYMPEFVAERIASILNDFHKSVNGSRILLLGVAYKKDIGDMRESPALRVIELLERYGAEILYNDPHIPHFVHKERLYESTEITKESLKMVDLVVIITDHSCYDYNYIVENSNIVFDTRNASREVVENREKIFRL